MPKPGEHKTVQARILHYAQEIGWTIVPREEADRRRGLAKTSKGLQDPASLGSLYFDDLLYQTVKPSIPPTPKRRARWSVSSACIATWQPRISGLSAERGKFFHAAKIANWTFVIDYTLALRSPMK
jgi:hypothetical protein